MPAPGIDLEALLNPDEDFSTPQARAATANALRRQQGLGMVGQLMGTQPTMAAGNAMQEQSTGSLRQAMVKQQAAKELKAQQARQAVEDQRYQQNFERQSRLDQQNAAHMHFMEGQSLAAGRRADANAGRVNDAATAAKEARDIAAGIKRRSDKGQLMNAIDAGTGQLNLIDSMITSPGREAATGASGLVASHLPFTVAREFQGKHNQLMGAAFMQAYQSLKGGGQITEVEGKKATDAMTVLNTPGLSEEAYLAGLNDLRGVVQRGIDKTKAAAYDAGYLQDSPQIPGSGDPRQQQGMPGTGGGLQQRDFMGEYGKYFGGQ